MARFQQPFAVVGIVDPYPALAGDAATAVEHLYAVAKIKAGADLDLSADHVAHPAQQLRPADVRQIGDTLQQRVTAVPHQLPYLMPERFRRNGAQVGTTAADLRLVFHHGHAQTALGSAHRCRFPRRTTPYHYEVPTGRGVHSSSLTRRTDLKAGRRPAGAGASSPKGCLSP